MERDVWKMPAGSLLSPEMKKAKASGDNLTGDVRPLWLMAFT